MSNHFLFKRSRIRALIKSGVFLLGGIFPLYPGLVPAQPAASKALKTGSAIEKELSGGQTHQYQLTMNANEFVRIVVVQQGIDVVVSLRDAAGNLLAEVDSPNGNQGTEVLFWETKQETKLQLEIKALEEKAEIGKYRLELTEQRPSVSNDVKRVEAQSHTAQGNQLRKEEKNGARELEIKEYEAAKNIYLEVGEQQAAAHNILRIGWGWRKLGKLEDAQKYYEQALTLYQATQDKIGIAVSMHYIGLAFILLSDQIEATLRTPSRNSASTPQTREMTPPNYTQLSTRKAPAPSQAAITQQVNIYRQKALESYQQALSIWRELQVREREVDALSGMASVYRTLREPQKIFEFYNQSLSLFRERKDRIGEAAILNRIGVAYNNLDDQLHAVESFKQALSLYRAEEDHRGEATVLENIASTYATRGFMEEALDSYRQLIAVYRITGDSQAEAKVLKILKKNYDEANKSQKALMLNEMGITYFQLGDRQQALKYYDQALLLWRSLKNKRGEARTLNNIGIVHSALGKGQEALNYYNEALQVLKEISDWEGQAQTMNNIGIVYSDLGDRQNALKYLRQAEVLHHSVGSSEASTLHNIGLIYYALGEKQKALDSFTPLLSLYRTTGDRQGQATILTSLGNVYYSLSEKQQALNYYRQALPLRRSIGDKRGEATTLNSLGAVYSALGDLQKALDSFNQALLLRQKIGDRRGEAATLNNLGLVYFDLNDPKKSLDQYSQALIISKSVGDRAGEAGVLNNLGLFYAALGENQKAEDYYQQSLPLRRSVEDRSGEAETLSNLMFVLKARQQPRLAVYYGKQSVNRYQDLRSAISGLDKDLQRSFLKSKEHTYRELADLLIGLGRLPEAQQVLGLLKEEEYFDYVRRDHDEASGLKGRASLTPTEARLEKEYAEIADLVTTLGRELEQLNQLKQPDAAQLARRIDLDQKLQLATQRFSAFLTRLETELGNTKDTGERLTMIQASDGLQDTLREIGDGTVALYTVVGEKKYSVILTPSTGPQIAAESNISREELHKKIFAFKDALRNPKVDPRPLGAELYDILIAPIAKNLDGAKAETLLFSLDGALRYVPMAALYDKQSGQYLIEKYRVVMYTPAGASDLKNAARANWKGLGFGVSKAISNDEVGSFNALNGVPGELSSVIRTEQQPKGVIEGRIYLDEQFTEQHFLDALRPREYPLIHIASHFAFKPGDSMKSFLLLGDGHGLTLEKIHNTANLFSKVDLLALSACETGVGQKDEEGKEVEGFGVLAQKRGAKAVLATLWAVSDESTAKLMSEFYRLRETQGLNKAEAMRQAQLQMLRGSASNGKQANRGAKSNAEIGKGLPEYKADEKAPYAHPYYWAPFILIGNWK